MLSAFGSDGCYSLFGTGTGTWLRGLVTRSSVLPSDRGRLRVTRSQERMAGIYYVWAVLLQLGYSSVAALHGCGPPFGRMDVTTCLAPVLGWLGYRSDLLGFEFMIVLNDPGRLFAVSSWHWTYWDDEPGSLLPFRAIAGDCGILCLLGLL
jgi:hypothetical protein